MNYYLFIYTLLLLAFSVKSESHRIVSLGSPVTEVILALGASDQLVGIDDSSQVPDELSSLPKVGYYRMVSAEGVLSVQPSLILSTEDAGPPPALKKIQAASVPLLRVSSEKTLSGAIERIQEISKVLDREEQAADSIKPLQDRLENPFRVLHPEVKVLFIYARGSGAPMVSGEGTGADEMIRLVGAQNAVTGFKRYRPLTPEALISAAPSIILVTTNGLAAIGGEEGLWALPGMNLTPAGKTKRFVSMDDSELLGFGPHTATALETLRKKLTL